MNAQWINPCEKKPSLLSPDQFKFLNVIHTLTSSDDWNHLTWEKLWLYNLHYFDDLNAENTADRKKWHQALIERWIMENPPVKGNGWEPYPISLRIVNWIKWALTGNCLSPKALHSLSVQTRYLCKRLEIHLLGNHLFANAKALVFAGLFFSGKEADAWLNKGLQILSREVSEQILSDGGHFEHSPMYHSIILEDLLDLINMDKVYSHAFPTRWRHLSAEWHVAVRRMLPWLKSMCHPDGEIALFNDAAFGIASLPGALEDYTQRLISESVLKLDEGITHLADSGYIRIQKEEVVALLDVGKIGPDYLPGHAHADILSFELSLFGQRVLVNSGTSCYGSCPERLRQRGTAAHNTVTINDEDSSEVWGGFRVARRAKPFDLEIQDGVNEIFIACSHNGYRRLSGKPVHRREWRLRKNELLIKDTILGSFKEAIARFYFHPEILIKESSSYHEGSAVFAGNRRRLCWRLIRGEGRLFPAAWYPEFGNSVLNQCLQVEFAAPEAEIIFFWE